MIHLLLVGGVTGGYRSVHYVQGTGMYDVQRTGT